MRTGRPRKKLDKDEVRKLSMIGCSHEMIGKHLGVSPDTLTRRYRAALDEGKADGQIRAIAKVFQSALAGNVRCLELFLCNRCGWSLRPEVAVSVVQNSLYGPGGPPVQMVSESELLKMAAIVAEIGNQAPGAGSQPARITGGSGDGDRDRDGGALGNRNGPN